MNITFGERHHTGMVHLDDGSAVEVDDFVEASDGYLAVIGRLEGQQQPSDHHFELVAVTGIHID